MGTGMKFITSVAREIDRAQKVAARERDKQEREHIRRQNQLEREQIREEKERNKANKEKVKHDLEAEQKIYEKRINERRTIRLDFLNRM